VKELPDAILFDLLSVANDASWIVNQIL